MSAAGLILAAGAGTRFGEQTKQLADLHGKPLLQHAVDAMNAALPRAVVVLGHDADAIRAARRLRPAAGRAVRGLGARPGVLAARRRGRAADAGAVAITLGDQPFITPAVITAALARAGRLRRPPGRLRRQARPPGRARPPRARTPCPSCEGDAGARELLARFRVRQWEAGHLASATDIDTPEELARL